LDLFGECRLWRLSTAGLGKASAWHAVHTRGVVDANYCTAAPRRADDLGGHPVELPITRRGRTICGVSHFWHAGACRGHPHEGSGHARITPRIHGVIFGLGIDVLGSPDRVGGLGSSECCQRVCGSSRSWAGHLGRLDASVADPSRPSTLGAGRGSCPRHGRVADEPQ
jgi:hypothetical protein